MKDLTQGNIYKIFVRFAIPMVIAGVLSQCYSVVNTIIAGKFLGDNSLAVIGAVAPLITFINSTFWGYGTGVGIYVGQLFGAGKYYRMKSVIVNNFKFVSLVIALLSVILLCFRNNMYSFLQIDNQIIEECNLYFIISTIGLPIVLFSINCIYVINSLGDSSFPLSMSIISTVLNILFSVMAIVLLDMGIEALALANVLSSAIVAVMYIIKLNSIFKKLNVNRHKAHFTLRAIKETCRYSISSMIQQSIMYFAGLLLSPMVNQIGSDASASYTVSLRIYDVNAAIYQNSAKTVGSFTAQCFGAKKYKLLKKGLIVGFVQNLIFILPFLIVTTVFSKQVTMLFYPTDASAVAVNYTIVFAKYFMPLVIFNIVANLFHNFFRGIGYMKALLATTIAGSVARIVISALLINTLGIYGYYVGWFFSWFFDAVVGIVLCFFGKWRKDIQSKEIF